MNFLRRNVPIVFIGFVVAIVFVAITIIGNARDPETTLVDAITATFNVSQREVEETPEEVVDTPETEQPAETTPEEPFIPPSTITGVREEEEIEVVYPTLEVVFTTDVGFNPRTTSARTGQTVRWVNKSGREITIKELIPKYPEFAQGIILAPEESYELLLNKSKTWTYKEILSGHSGKLNILVGTINL